MEQKQERQKIQQKGDEEHAKNKIMVEEEKPVEKMRVFKDMYSDDIRDPKYMTADEREVFEQLKACEQCDDQDLTGTGEIAGWESFLGGNEENVDVSWDKNFIQQAGGVDQKTQCDLVWGTEGEDYMDYGTVSNVRDVIPDRSEKALKQRKVLG